MAHVKSFSALALFHTLVPLSASAICVTAQPSSALIYYVSPAGSDFNSCTTLAAPCLTLNTAVQKAMAAESVNGTRIVLRGGRYHDASVSVDGYVGAAGRPFMIEAYLGETPQFNNLHRFTVSGSSYVNVCDVQIRWATDRAFYFSYSTAVSLENVLGSYSMSNGIYWSNVTNSRMINVTVSRSRSHGIHLVNSSGNWLRNIATTVNKRSGLAIQGGVQNYIDQIVASYNFDSDGQGENADGISISSGGYNTVKNCTAAHNDDDGIDTWQSIYNIIETCASSYNGIRYANPYRPPGNVNVFGDGNGYKLGGPGGHNRVVNSLAYRNSGYGFSKNSGTGNICFNDRAVGNTLGPTSFSSGESCSVNVRPY
jgi:parallel beta-helix repeat protein